MEARAQIPVSLPVVNPIPSYWQNPKATFTQSSNLSTYPSSQPWDYAIIGCGISGTMIAYNLLKKDPSSRVIMLEAREICSGATGRNGGHTKAASYRTYLQHKEELGKDEALRIARLEYANIIATHALAVELGLDCENQICNTVDIIYDKQTFEDGKKAIAELVHDASDEERQPGKMAYYRVYEKHEDIEQKFWVSKTNSNPSVRNKQPEQVEGAFEYLAGRIHAYRFTTSILSHLVESKGLQIHPNTPVTDISSSPSSTPEAPLWTLTTPTATIPSKTVILATNGYTPFLLPTLQSAIVPLRGQITAQLPPSQATYPTPLPTTYSFIYASGYEYMIPRPLPTGTQHIIIGGGLGRLPLAGASEYGTVDDSVLNGEVSTYLRGTLEGYFSPPPPPRNSSTSSSSPSPAAQHDPPRYQTVHEWTGIMGATADGRPFVGQVPGKQGLWVCAGFNGHGMVLCVKAAEGVVGMMGRDGGVEGLEWFPRSFLVRGERIGGAFGGRTDMRVPETRGGSVGGGRGRL